MSLQSWTYLIFKCKECVLLICTLPDHRLLGTSRRRTQSSCSFSWRGQWKGRKQLGTADRNVAWAPGSACYKDSIEQACHNSRICQITPGVTWDDTAWYVVDRSRTEQSKKGVVPLLSQPITCLTVFKNTVVTKSSNSAQFHEPTQKVDDDSPSRFNEVW